MGFRLTTPIVENQVENKMENEMETGGIYRGYLWLAGNEGMEKNMETTVIIGII